MSLRDGAVEAIARGHLHDFDALSEGSQNFYLDAAALSLDALCDYLTEHADEWKAASYETVADADPDVFGAAALAALARGDTREDTE